MSLFIFNGLSLYTWKLFKPNNNSVDALVYNLILRSVFLMKKKIILSYRILSW